MNAHRIANILWDHYGYVLGHPKDTEKKSKEMADRQMESFIAVIAEALAQYPDSPTIGAISNFYKTKEWGKVFSHPLWEECAKRKGCNLGFRIDGVGVATDSRELSSLSA